MKAQVVRGSKQEIADTVIRTPGQVREAIIFVEEPTDRAEPLASTPQEDIFAEMQPFVVSTGGADYSREAIYRPLEDE